MLLETNQMIPVTKLQKELTKRIREISETGETLYILKNNNMEVVMLSFDEYEYLHNLEEMFEQMEIKTMLDARLSRYSAESNKAWDDIREDV